MKIRAAVDIGGTFTDIILYDEERGKFWKSKVRSSSQKPEEPFIKGILKTLETAKKDISDIKVIVHGTTIVTNSLLEGKTAKVGLVVTKGFRDILEIGRQQRPDLYDLMKDRKKPLVPRYLIKEVKERITAQKKVLTPLNKDEVKKTLKELDNEEIKALAVVLLFSFHKPAHEVEVKKTAQKIWKKKPVYLSSEVSPEFREYERASTTVIAASVAPKVIQYIRAVQKKLKEADYKSGDMVVMHSGGGISTPKQAKEQPHTMVESGPAAGLIGASNLSQMMEMDKVIALDMGGTTAKAGMILNGELVYTPEYEVGGELHFSGRQKGSGYTVRTPMIDVIECGAGAGSIAWMDKGGHIKVGPQSAGADPGPACYGKGGKEPTVTDAHLILGRLSEENFLGGEMKLDKKKAIQAVKKNLCAALDMSEKEAASGVLSIANASMLRILRLLSVSKGYDPREFTLMAYGGAGPLHAVELADEMSISKVVIPRMAGLFSSLGLLFADMSADFAETVMVSLEKDRKKINEVLSSLNKKAEKWFEEHKVPENKQKVMASADMRLVRQNYELNIRLPELSLSKSDINEIKSKFHDEHEKTYGHKAPKEEIQVVNLRMRALEIRKKPDITEFEKTEKHKLSEEETRKVWIKDKERECSVYEREKMLWGHCVKGPAVITEKESTTVIGPQWKAEIGKLGNLILTK
ncbi:MAG: hydantoinase/oxoprolinase family protein [Acidobacteriota bacterium]